MSRSAYICPRCGSGRQVAIPDRGLYCATESCRAPEREMLPVYTDEEIDLLRSEIAEQQGRLAELRRNLRRTRSLLGGGPR